ncbi:MAG TPA: hypothetical protein VGP43_00215 [Chitinophagaceae bacterium]|nr:hypothetical protein [Chitinophagaceae bacterium]
MKLHKSKSHSYKCVIVFFLAATFSCCETNRFNSDKRQILAINEVRKKTGKPGSFDIISFREDTLQNWPDTNFRHPIQYTLYFVYKDSANTMQKKKGLVIFTSERNEIISSAITEQ